ncbi:nitroreductase family protein [Thalassotalea euphylliae]|uniref:nitroreductase family protein n=1 Tax=Thalassotalea euphylliae TaxID=1655234 RepID=UPI00363D41CB
MSSSFIEFLQQRYSNPNLCEPAPSASELEQILQSAMSAPDHAGLTPWQITVVSGEARAKLAEAFVASVKANGGDDAKLVKAEKMPFRAPMMLIVSTNYQDHPKVPECEQLISAGCAAHAMQYAALSLGYNTMWRTGDMAFCHVVKEKIGIDTDNDIVGYLYLGTESKALATKARKDFSEVTRYL